MLLYGPFYWVFDFGQGLGFLFCFFGGVSLREVVVFFVRVFFCGMGGCLFFF